MRIDLTGRRFGKWTVLEYSHSKHLSYWLCKCDCGTIKSVVGTSLSNGSSACCGCVQREKLINRNYRHGFGRDKPTEYRIWLGLKNRCYNPRNPSFKRYGKRGITVSPDWADSFMKFYNDMGRRPGLEYTIDRIDNDGPYSKENCRWADIFTQANNTRKNKYISYNGQSHSISEWSRLVGLSSGTLNYRINSGWPIEKALTTKLKTA